MFCKKCHTKLPEGAVICAVCGTNNADTELTNIVTNIVRTQNPEKEIKVEKQDYKKKSISVGAVIVVIVVIILLIFISLKAFGEI
ncbi:MAG TPA: hypothetical protein PLX66_00720 [Bacilli bacterium]|nr:hypothetical protein [Bacilli bacterium]